MLRLVKSQITSAKLSSHRREQRSGTSRQTTLECCRTVGDAGRGCGGQGAEGTDEEEEEEEEEEVEEEEVMEVEVKVEDRER